MGHQHHSPGLSCESPLGSINFSIDKERTSTHGITGWTNKRGRGAASPYCRRERNTRCCNAEIGTSFTSVYICLSKPNIPRIDVRNLDFVSPKLSENRFHFWPVILECVRLHSSPIGPDFGRIVWRVVQISTTKIKTKWRANNGHAYCEKIVFV